MRKIVQILGHEIGGGRDESDAAMDLSTGNVPLNTEFAMSPQG